MGNSIVFVDWRVADIDSLVAGMPSDIEIDILDSASDGLDQIATRLQGRSGLDAIHIISHGSSGSLTLGSGIFDTDDLYTHLGQLESIGKSLTESGDILLYGCNVAAGEVGAQFIGNLAQATGADVAASTDFTGATRLEGGDWVLEAQTGSIEAALPLSQATIDQSNLLLATSISNGFRHPLGSGFLTEGATTSWSGTDEGRYTDPATGATYHGFYTATDFNEKVWLTDHYSYHLGEDWNGSGGGNTDLGVPVLAISNGQVIQAAQSADPGLGYYVVIRHDLPSPIVVNGITTSTIVSLYAHLQSAPGVQVDDYVSIGQQIGNLGSTGDSALAHLHFEIRLGVGAGFQDADGYNRDGAPTGWVDPTDFINQHRTLGSAQSVSINDVQITEGNSGTQVMTFTVTRTGGTDAFDVNYLTADGTAGVTDGDYLAASGTLHFDANVDTQTILVTITGDTTDVADEHFYVGLSGATNGVVIGDGVGRGDIASDDAAGSVSGGITWVAVRPVFQGKTGSELANAGSFAALRADGSVVTWGDSGWGGNSSAVVSQIDGTVDVVEVFSTLTAFAALRADGSVVTWGSSGTGGDSSAVASQIDGTVDVVGVFSTDGAFAALRADGSLVTWGENDYGGNSSSVANQLDGTVDVVEVFSKKFVFAALHADGSVVTWGDYSWGGNSSAVASQLDGTVDVVDVFSTNYAVAALRADGSVVTWGDSGTGGNSSAVASQINGTLDVVKVFSNWLAFAALRSDGSVVTWGESGGGGDSSAVASQIDGTLEVLDVFSADSAFAALRADGSVVTWGWSGSGGDSSAVASQINGTVDVLEVFSTQYAFAALRADGSVVTWGNSFYGSNSSAVASQLDGTVDVVEVFSTERAFAALRADGSVVTWGNSGWGGNSSAVVSQIDGTVDVVEVFSTLTAFAALRADGSVVTWGSSGAGGDSSAVASQIDGGIDVITLASPFSRRVEATGADSADDYADEAGDSSAPVGILTVGSTITGLIGAADSNDTYGDKDVFKVLLTQGQSYAIRLQSTLVDGQALPQGIFTLRDGANFSTILDTSSIGADVTENFTAGTTSYHYIRVGTGGAATDQGGYQLSVTALNEWSITSAANRVAENSGSVTFTVTRPSDVGNQTVYVSTVWTEGFLNAGDYTTQTYAPLSFTAGQTSQIVTINLNADTYAEPNEVFGLIVQQSANPDPEIHLAKQTFTLLNDDTADWSITPEGSYAGEASGNITFTITRPVGGPTQTVYVKLPSGSNDDDYVTPPNNRVTFAAGETTATVSVAIIDDAVAESEESFSIVVLQAPNDRSSDGVAETFFSIVDDDTVPGLAPGTPTADKIFAKAEVGSELYFLATMAEAAYHLRGDEPEGSTLNPLNDYEHSAAAAGEFADVDKYLDLLSAVDLPGLGLTNVGGAFPNSGIADGIYTSNNAAALVGRSEDALFLAFRGTNDNDLGLLNLGAVLGGGGSPDADHWFDHPILNEVSGGPFNDQGMAGHYALFAPLVAALDSYINDPTNGIDKIYVTGHSLGAGMVQAYMDQHSDDYRFDAITFADPGYEGFDGLALNFTDPRITTFRIEGDPILLGDLANLKGGDSYLIEQPGVTLPSTDYHDMAAYLAVANYLTDSGIEVPFDSFARDVGYNEGKIKVSLSQLASGNWLANAPSGTLLGSEFIDYLWSSYGSDALFGGAGDDYLYAGDGEDTAYGQDGNDALVAGTGGGDDYYDGGDDIDTVVYTSTARGIVVNLALPQDQATGPEIDADQIFNVENVVGGDGDDRITGDSMDNRLEGGSGQDAMDGGSGNDIIHGGDGNDLLNGGRGADQMAGGGGNDIYVVDHRFDQVTEVADSGLDSVSAKANHVLMDNVENLFLTGFVTVRSGGFFSRKTTTIDLSIDGTGNETDNLLRGNRGHNQLDGLGGNDTLLGGAGADVLQGGTGADRLVGGAGADVFVFAAGDGGTSLAAADMLYDFEDGIDRIALAGGLDFANLTITQGDGTDTAAGNTVIGTSSGEYLAVLLNTSTGTITGLDFQLLGV